MAKNSPPVFEWSTPVSRSVSKIAMTLADSKKALKAADVGIGIVAFQQRKSFGTNKLQDNAE